jgi:nucleoid DNA-binding protein
MTKLQYIIIKREEKRIMTITREEMIRKLSDKSGYYQKDIRTLLQCLDEIVFDELSSVTDNEEVSIQLVSGIKVKTSVVPERDRVDPRNQKPIVVKATVKPSCKFSQDYRFKLQEAYENNKNG